MAGQRSQELRECLPVLVMLPSLQEEEGGGWHELQGPLRVLSPSDSGMQTAGGSAFVAAHIWASSRGLLAGGQGVGADWRSALVVRPVLQSIHQLPTPRAAIKRALVRATARPGIAPPEKYRQDPAGDGH